MSAYGNVTCNFCGESHHELEDHICSLDALKAVCLKRDELEDENKRLREACKLADAALLCVQDHTYYAKRRDAVMALQTALRGDGGEG